MTINELLRRRVESIDDVIAVFRAPPGTLGTSVSSDSACIYVTYLWTNLQRELGGLSLELAEELDALGQLEPHEILALRGSRPSYFLAYKTLAGMKGTTP